MVTPIAAVLFLPLAGAVLLGLCGRWLPKALISAVGCGSVLAAFVVATLNAPEAKAAGETVLWQWMPLARADFALLWDPLSSLMTLVVTGVGFLIHLYSIGYMAHERGYSRYFACLNLFVFFMLLLVLANNYLLLFAGWEGVGLASYALIGFYLDRRSAGDAAKKAFIVNRIGDAGFLLGLFLLWTAVGSFRYAEVGARAGAVSGPVLEWIALLLFIGAIGKSAQFPLHVWLPDAMEGPTPVSALIHAATMVTAGAYMVVRSAPLYERAPEASTVVAVIGAVTAVMAATIAIGQNDIKRILAYSTVSQLGLMFLAAGVGAYGAAMFHFFTHAFFKALLFLGAGSVIHGVHGEQDIRRMGGLRGALPVTWWTMVAGSAALAGIPGLAGFFSKEEILAAASDTSPLLLAAGLTVSVLTAAYMTRLLILAFLGASRTAVHAHESPLVMTTPLVLLAVCSFGAGYAPISHWLRIDERHPHGSLLLALSIAAVAGGILLGWLLSKRALPAPLASALAQRWYIDRVYDGLLVNRGVLGSSRLLARFDSGVVDGGVNGAGWLTRAVAALSHWWDTWIIDGLVRWTSDGVRMLSIPVRLLQTGYVQTYALVVLSGAVVLFGFYWMR